jgi:hypothetical protein
LRESLYLEDFSGNRSVLFPPALDTIFRTNTVFGEREEMDGRDGTREDTQDTTRLLEIEKVKRAIRATLFVTKVSTVDAHKDKVTGWGSTLKCSSCPEYCERRQEAPVQLSRDRKTELACLQDLLKRLQDRHFDCAEALTKKTVSDVQATAAVSAGTPSVDDVVPAGQKTRTSRARLRKSHARSGEGRKEG